MLNLSINLWGVLGATVVAYIIGFLWFGPIFGKQWIKLSKMSASDIAKAKQKSMAKPMILNFIGTFIMAFVFAQLINLVGISTAGQGAVLGFWLWLGFFASSTLLGSVLWEGKSWSLYVLTAAYWLVNLKVMGFLLVLWN
ncbi:MAG: DUF1761 domain-containing protein [Candidatus Pacearchaeota archaeon]